MKSILRIIFFYYLPLILCSCSSNSEEEIIAPTANFSYQSSEIESGELFEFTDNSNQGSATINKWTWNFGDSSDEENSTNAQHTYTINGTYIVKLKVEDTNGQESQIQKEIEVNSIVTPNYERIKIINYNIFHAESPSGTINVDLIANILEAENADLIALQEVDVKTRRSNYIDQVQELATKLGMLGYFCKFINYQGGEYGSAILSKFRVLNFTSWPMYNNGAEARSFGVAKIQLPSNRIVYFNSSHLSTNNSERAQQINEINTYYSNNLDRSPLLICGDLNAEPESDDINNLKSNFKLSDTDLQNTFSTRTGMRKKIDYILMPNNDNWTVLEDIKIISNSQASDHCALVATLGYKE